MTNDSLELNQCEDCGSIVYPFHDECCTLGETSEWKDSCKVEVINVLGDSS